MKKCGCCGEKITGKCYTDKAGKSFHNTCVKSKTIIIAKETEDAKKIKPSSIPPIFEDSVISRNVIGEINVKKDSAERA